MQKTCGNCIKGIPVPINNDIFCREKGIVSPGFTCRRHRFMPEARPFKEMNYKCIHCENFILNAGASEKLSSIGLCRLFSVRQFDGEQKNACSKFAKKSHLSVS